MVNKEVLDLLTGYVSENKNDLFDKIIPERTKYITVVLENIFQPHNASAVLRSAECFGVQDLHVIENEYEYAPNKRVVMGAAKWVDVHKYSEKENNTVDCINHLKNQGYRIVATSPHSNDCNIDELDLEKGPIALMFGSEEPGLSDLAMEHADEFVKIPMHGFTESFNISVSAALCLFELTTRLRKSNVDWRLSPEEQEELRYQWCKKVVKNADLIEQHFLNNQDSK